MCHERFPQDLETQVCQSSQSASAKVGESSKTAVLGPINQEQRNSRVSGEGLFVSASQAHRLSYHTPEAWSSNSREKVRRHERRYHQPWPVQVQIDSPFRWRRFALQRHLAASTFSAISSLASPQRRILQSWSKHRSELCGIVELPLWIADSQDGLENHIAEHSHSLYRVSLMS